MFFSYNSRFLWSFCHVCCVYVVIYMLKLFTSTYLLLSFIFLPGGEDFPRLRPLYYPGTVSFCDFSNSMVCI